MGLGGGFSGESFASPILQFIGNLVGGYASYKQGEKIRTENPPTRFRGLLGTDQSPLRFTGKPGGRTVQQQTGMRDGSQGGLLSPRNVVGEALAESGRVFDAQTQKREETLGSIGAMTDTLGGLVEGARERAEAFGQTRLRGLKQLTKAREMGEALWKSANTMEGNIIRDARMGLQMMSTFYNDIKDRSEEMVNNAKELMIGHLTVAHQAGNVVTQRAMEQVAQTMQNAGASAEEQQLAKQMMMYDRGSDIFAQNAVLAEKEMARLTEVEAMAVNMRKDAAVASVYGGSSLFANLMSGRAKAADVRTAAATIVGNARKMTAQYAADTALAQSELSRYADGLEWQGSWDLAQMLRDTEIPVLATSGILMSGLSLYSTLAQMDNEVNNQERAFALGNFNNFIQTTLQGLTNAGQLADASLQRKHETSLANKQLWGNIGAAGIGALGDIFGGGFAEGGAFTT